MPPASSRLCATDSGGSCISRKIRIIFFRSGQSFALRSEIQRLHHELVLTAIEHHLANFAELPFDDGVVLARNHVAREHCAGLEAPRARIKLYPDVGSDHRAKNGDVLFLIDPQENEEQWVGLGTRDDGAAK